MKKNLAVLSFILGAALSAVQAQLPTSITFDEFGHGTWAPGAPPPGPAVLVGALGPDPSGPLGVILPVLIYTIPGPSLVQGDILIYEGTNILSDVVRIWQGNKVIFYSDREQAGDTDPADSGLPLGLQANNLSVFETGVEGNNSATYTAFASMPGWDGNPAGTTYQIISDVPEPAVFPLAGIGCGLAFALRQRRSRA